MLFLKNKILISSFLVVVLLVFSGVYFYQTKAQQEALASLPDASLIKIPLDNIIEYTDAGKNSNQEEVIKYTYLSEQVIGPQQYKGLKEDINLRTPTSQAFVKEVKPLNAKESQVTYVGKFYSGPTFSNQKDGEWRTVEYATTTKSAFLLQTKPTILTQMKGLLGQPVFAATYYAGGGDGASMGTGEDGEYDISPVRSLASGYSDSSSNGTQVYVYLTSDYGGYYELWRVFLPFNTSNIPSDAIISSANLNLMINYKYTIADGYNYFRVVQTSQDSNSTLANGDYSKCGSLDAPTAGASDTNMSSVTVSTSVYNTVALNSTGLSWIKKSGQTSSCGVSAGWTCLGIRDGHDVTDQNIAMEGASGISFATSELIGTSQDPYLDVTYSVVMPSVKINGGTMNINGGTVKVNGN
ncbi:MAG: hypothetical protein WCW56_02230 [Candidatus Paceibacterota bacterium]|jgi:hypothetical protein